MYSKLSKAREKFWITPELVEKLLPFLDPESILVLAQCYETVAGVLQGTCIWNQFIRRAFLDQENRSHLNLDVVRCLVGILKLMKKPKGPRADLLELICQRFPPEEHQQTFLHQSCPRHPEGHQTSREGFLLLEEVEGAFGSTDMKIETIYSERDYCNVSFWTAISARLTRCDEAMTSVEIIAFGIHNALAMRAFRIVLQFSPTASTYLEAMYVDIENLAMVQEFRNFLLICPEPREPLNLTIFAERGEIGNEGWELLAKAVQLRPGFVESIICSHHVLQEAKMEDIRVVWEVVGDVELGHYLHDWNESLKWSDGEKAWERLVQIIEMTEDDLNKDIEEKEGCEGCLSESEM